METRSWRNDVNRFDRALRELRSERPTAGMEAARAQFKDRPTPSRLPRVIAFGLAAGVVGIAPFVLRTPAAATMTMAEIRAAAEAAPRVHSRWYQVKDGKDVLMYMEQWQDGPRFRHDVFPTTAKGACQYGFDGTRGWYRVHAKRYVTLANEPKFGGTFTGPLFDRLRATDGSDQKDVPVREVVLDGKRMREITFDTFVYQKWKYVNTARDVWTIDPEAKRPHAMRSYRSHGKDWIQVARATFEYPEELDLSVFRLSPKPGETLFDKDEEARSLPALWAKGLGRQTVGGQTISLCDVVLDRNGIAGVVWTGGGRFEKAKDVVLRDGKGRQWKATPYLAYTRSPLNRIPESRLTKIAGKPNRMALLYGLHGVVTAPLKVEIPVADAQGKPRGTATFRVPKFRSTDELYDLPDQMGIAEKGKGTDRAVKRAFF